MSFSSVCRWRTSCEQVGVRAGLFFFTLYFFFKPLFNLVVFQFFSVCTGGSSIDRGEVSVMGLQWHGGETGLMRKMGCGFCGEEDMLMESEECFFFLYDLSICW